MPFAQDVVTRIVNVHWGGGAVFIYGEWLGNLLHYVKVKDSSSDPLTQTVLLPEPPSRDLETTEPRFSVTGSSYAEFDNGDDTTTPVFLVCGGRSVPKEVEDNVGNTVPATNSYALIYASNDGLDWWAAHQQETISEYSVRKSVGPRALVWTPDNAKFYYDQGYSEFRILETTEPVSLDQVYGSIDGTSGWERVSSTETGASLDYKSSFPTEYCAQNDCLDGLNQHVPDGVMFNDRTTSTAPPSVDEEPKIVAIKPTAPPVVFYHTGGVSFTPGKNTVEIKRAKRDGSSVEESQVAIPGIGCVTCVAGVNGIYMAGGFVSEDDILSAGAVAISFDDGVTWWPFASTQNGVTTMIAGMLDPPGSTPSRRNARL